MIAGMYLGLAATNIAAMAIGYIAFNCYIIYQITINIISQYKQKVFTSNNM